MFTLFCSSLSVYSVKSKHSLHIVQAALELVFHSCTRTSIFLHNWQYLFTVIIAQNMHRANSLENGSNDDSKNYQHAVNTRHLIKEFQ